jgi:uncharacterized protein (DUF1800 family)
MRVGPHGVTLRWSAPKGTKPAIYQVLRNGRVLARTTHRSFTDATVKPGRTYRYAIRGLDAHGRRGLLSKAIRAAVPKLSSGPLPAPAGSAGPTPSIAPIAQGSPPAPMAAPLTAAMVDRLFWRAGFGPSQAHRSAWVGRPPTELVDWLLDTPPTLLPATTPPKTGAGLPIDPLASDDELVMEWLDGMQRAVNPLPERLAFFWHRHWAVSRDDGTPARWMLTYRDRMRTFADLPGNPGLSFRSIAYEMSTADGAMSAYLNGSSNVKGSPNENYAREFMELFCLGPKGPDGTDNYVQADVAGLARAFTGWRVDGTDTSPTYGQVFFTPGRFEPGAKTFLGQTIPAVSGAVTDADGPACVGTAVDVVVAHRNHPQFLIRKLWGEFIASPIPQATLDDLVAQYTAGGKLALRPVLRGILTHPLIFESIDEPNLVKPPIVYMVGLLRQLGAPMKGNHFTVALANMQQRPYHPPNVAGWEGGLSWLNSNTVQGRFDAVVRAQYLKYSSYYAGGAAPVPDDVPGETVQAGFDRAYAAAGAPWVSAGTRAALLSYAATLPASTVAQRRQRFYTLQALILGGPDGQVM